MRRYRRWIERKVSRLTDSEFLCPPACKLERSKLNIIRTSPSGHTHFVQAIEKFEHGRPVLAERGFLVVPNKHYGPRETVPFDFKREVDWHIDRHDMRVDNWGFNLTIEGGSSILDHAHAWIVTTHQFDHQLGIYSLREVERSERLARRDLATPDWPI